MTCVGRSCLRMLEVKRIRRSPACILSPDISVKRVKCPSWPRAPPPTSVSPKSLQRLAGSLFTALVLQRCKLRFRKLTWHRKHMTPGSESRPTNLHFQSTRRNRRTLLTQLARFGFPSDVALFYIHSAPRTTGTLYENEQETRSIKRGTLRTSGKVLSLNMCSTAG